jgi:hypothetical protein
MRRFLSVPVIVGLTGLAIAALALMGLFDPAFAFARPPRPTPVPLIGVGLPLAGCVLAALAIARRFRR